MKTLTSIITFLVILVGCGTADMPTNKTDETASPDDKKTTELKEQTVTINGYVSPINISVDGVNYSDSEDFYTQEVDRLTKMVKQQYPHHSLYFDAEVGLRDFKQGLVAYLVSSGDVGVADETPVNGKGQFTFNLPVKTDLTQSYILRSYKRIGLRLEYKDEVITWCYNFFAEKNVFLENGKSLILRDFVTKVTKYQCQTEKKSGITIPYPDMPSIPVKEAFEESETWPGYGPTPKAKNANKGAVVNPSSDKKVEEEAKTTETTEEKVEQTTQSANEEINSSAQ